MRSSASTPGIGPPTPRASSARGSSRPHPRPPVSVASASPASAGKAGAGDRTVFGQHGHPHRAGRRTGRQPTWPGRPLSSPRGGRHPTPLTNLGGLCLELLSGKGLESAFLEEIGLKHETVFCHHGAVLSQAPMETRTVPWLHSVRLPARGHLPNRHNGEPSVVSRSLARCVSFSPLKSGNKSNKPQASTVAGKGFAGHCNPSS